MDFAIRNLSVLAYAQGFTLWHYRSDCAPPDRVADPGFFNDAADMFAVGDMMLVSAGSGGRVLFVSRVEGGVATAPMAWCASELRPVRRPARGGTRCAGT